MTKMMNRFAAVAVAALLLGGCASPYINVPALPGDVASNDANNELALSMEVAALKHVLKERPPGGAYAISLPKGTSAESYAFVVSQLSPGVERHGEQAQAQMPVYKVNRVHGRTSHGQVDLIVPRELGGEDLINCYMALDIEGWYVQRSRVWRVPLDKAIHQLPNDEALLLDEGTAAPAEVAPVQE